MDARWDGGRILNILPAGKQTGRGDASPAAGGQIRKAGNVYTALSPSEASARDGEDRSSSLWRRENSSGSAGGVMESRRGAARPIHPQRPFVPIRNRFHQTGGQNPHRSPLLGWKQSLVGSMSTVHLPLVPHPQNMDLAGQKSS